MRQIVLDYETRSEADLKKTGGVKYAQDPSTEIICVGYKIDDEPARIWLPLETPSLPSELLEAGATPSVVWIAHNALFEGSITEYVLRKRFPSLRPLPPERWRCTAAKAAVFGLPRNLEGACLALDLPVKKNMDGRRLMLKHSKPRRQWRQWSGEGDSPEKYSTCEFERWAIYDYCKTDVEAEYLLDKRLPDLIPIEREIWLLNQKMNLRGVQVDTDSARLILGLIARHCARLEAELSEITDGEVTKAGQRDRIIKWLGDNGLSIASLSAETVEATLAAIDEVNLRGRAPERVLQIRLALAKSSTKKYQAILNRAGVVDGRVRDIALYHGATTGRESGTGLQLQNLPKGKIKNTDLAIDIVKRGDADISELIYGDPMALYSACVRGMVTASPGKSLFVADYMAIEARVLAWLANDETALETFREGRDPYVKQACNIFRLGPEQITEALRFIGKIAELGLGYQMGARKFYETCVNWGATGMTPEIAERAVQSYRAMHEPISKLWPRIERLAISAVRNPAKVYESNLVSLGVSEGSLYIELPSKRRIHYYAPEVRLEPTPWGEMRPKLYHWSSHSLTKKWECAATYGGLLVENITQAVARDINLHSALRLEAGGVYSYGFQIHDEIVAEAKIGDGGTVREFENILTTLPAWAEGLPLKAKGWTGYRYKKG